MLAELALRLLLAPLPSALRRAHGREMRQLARDRWREAARSPRRFARLRVACALCVDVLRSAPREHLIEWRRRRLAGPSRRKGHPMSDFLNDVRHALRLAAASPIFTAAATLTLALGIGAATAIYSLADATLLRPLPVRAVDRLYATRWSSSYPAFQDYLARTDVFDGVAAFSGRDAISVQREAGTELVGGAFVSGTYFGVLGVGAQTGRTLGPADDRPGAPLVAVLSDRYWRTTCGADPAVVGSTVRLNGRPALVVGVAARRFRGTTLQADPAVWIPLAAVREVETATFFNRVDPLQTRDVVWLRLVVRLEADVTPERARSVMQATYAANHPASPELARDAAEAAEIHPLAAAAAGLASRGNLARFLLLLGGLITLTLLIASANLANMLLVRAAARRREIAVRLALGAGRGRLIRQMLTENLSIALVGGAAGLLVAEWMIALLGRFELPGNIPIQDLRLVLDRRTISVTLGVSTGTALLFGLVPALQASATEIISALRDQTRATARHRLRGTLIAAQVGLSLLLLAGGALFVRGLERALDADLGFRPEGVAMATVDLGLERYDAGRAVRFYDSTLERLHAVPAIRAAAWTSRVPMRGVMMWTVEVDGFTPPKGREVHADVTYVHGRYFQALGVPILEGRPLDARDRDGAPLAAVVNRAMTAKYWPGRPALGGRFRFGKDEPSVEVVGIAGDLKGRGIDQEIQPTMYLPFLQHRRNTLLDQATLIARTDADAGAIAGALAATVRGVDPRLPLARIMTLEQHVRNQVMPQQMGVRLFSFFGLLALAIAAVGIYGVAAASVVERTRELGIRMALGARERQVVGLVQRQTLVPVAAGVIAGLLLAVWTARLVGALLYGLDPDDPAAFAAVAAALAAVALVAAWVPARRAARVDPVITLRSE